MKTFYISLVRDLLGAYLEVQASSEEDVRRYLVQEYFDDRSKIWKLPWCSIYEGAIPDVPHERVVIIKKYERI